MVPGGQRNKRESAFFFLSKRESLLVGWHLTICWPLPQGKGKTKWTESRKQMISGQRHHIF